MGKTYKDIKKFDIKRHKEGAREVFGEQDMRTRVKPIGKKERKPTVREILDNQEDESMADLETELAETAYHALTGE